MSPLTNYFTSAKQIEEKVSSTDSPSPKDSDISYVCNTQSSVHETATKFKIKKRLSEPLSMDQAQYNTKINAKLDVKDSKCTVLLHQMYYSRHCQWFYFSLVILSVCLLLMAFLGGMKIGESPEFIALELLFNILITADIGCRVKLVGCKKFLRDTYSGTIFWWNILEAFMVAFCDFFFVLAIFAETDAIRGIE